MSRPVLPVLLLAAALPVSACGDGSSGASSSSDASAGGDTASPEDPDGGSGTGSSSDATTFDASDAASSASHLKLGIHELGSTTDSATVTLLQACPRAVKWMSNGGFADNAQIASAMASYRASCPHGTTVLRVYIGDAHYAATDDPGADANDFWQRMRVGLAGIPPASVDWLEGPNELDNVPDWYHDLGVAQWFASFWDKLADAMNAASFHPLVGSIAVGNPGLVADFDAGIGAMQPLADIIKKKTYPIGWSYHSYTPNAQEDVSQEIWYSLRYRTIAQQSGLAGVPIVLTEGGQDAPGGWQGRTSSTSYLTWLRWLDGQMNQDPDVVGLTIFQVGDHAGWSAFDLSPIAMALASYEASPAAGWTCQAYAQTAGWSSSKCESGGNGACGAQGPPSTDCDHCCP